MHGIVLLLFFIDVLFNDLLLFSKSASAFQALSAWNQFEANDNFAEMTRSQSLNAYYPIETVLVYFMFISTFL